MTHTHKHTLPFRHALIYTTVYLQSDKCCYDYYYHYFHYYKLKDRQDNHKKQKYLWYFRGFDDFLVVVDTIITWFY